MSSLRRKYSFTQLQHTTGMAQRKRAGLITLRTPDRNGLPVLLINSHQCIKALRALRNRETFYRCSSAAERLKTSFATFLTL